MSRKSLQDIPFVFLTYLADKELITEGLDLEALDYIIKDTPVNVIISKLNNILLVVNKQRELSLQEVKHAAKSLNIKSILLKYQRWMALRLIFGTRLTMIFRVAILLILYPLIHDIPLLPLAILWARNGRPGILLLVFELCSVGRAFCYPERRFFDRQYTAKS
jgi:hypothetical protein